MTLPLEFRPGVIAAMTPPRLPAIGVPPPCRPTALAIPVLGPQGPQGPPGDTTNITVTGIAATSLSGHRAITRRSDGQLIYATNDDASMIALPIWITTAAALIGTSVDAIAYGPITEPSWSWTPGSPIFLGANGTLTQTAPTAPAVFLAQLGTALTPTQMFIQRNPSIHLS